jgi:hypothetical protein
MHRETRGRIAELARDASLDVEPWPFAALTT